MVIDPATEAQALAVLDVLASTRHLSMQMVVAERVVAVLAPLIRRQAFNEAAEALEAARPSGSVDEWGQCLNEAYELAAQIVRGLRETQ